MGNAGGGRDVFRRLKKKQMFKNKTTPFLREWGKKSSGFLCNKRKIGGPLTLGSRKDQKTERG